MKEKLPPREPSSRVVSVRLDVETIDRLNRLADGTSRSRGFYLKMAIQAMLPIMEENHWMQEATAYEESVIDREFHAIMGRVLPRDDHGPSPTR